MKSLLYITNYPAPYRVQFFNELGRHYKLTVLFEETAAQQTHRDPAWFADTFQHFEAVFLKSVKVRGKRLSFEVLRWINQKYDYVVIGVYSMLTAQLAMEYMNMRKMPYFLETDGGYAKDGRGPMEKWKRHLISGAARWFSPSACADDYLAFYGADRDRIVRYPFTSLWARDLRTVPVSPVEKAALRAELAIPEPYMVMTVGQFIPRKANEILIEAARQLDPAVGVYIIGGKATEEYTRLIAEWNLPNVHLLDFKKKDELKKYYQAADVFALPTREDIWGLVINEALAYGLPVVSSDKCIAAQELVAEGENGYIVPVNDPGALAGKLNRLLNDDGLRQSMARCALDRIGLYTIESMVEAHRTAMP